MLHGRAQQHGAGRLVRSVPRSQTSEICPLFSIVPSGFFTVHENAADGKEAMPQQLVHQEQGRRSAAGQTEAAAISVPLLPVPAFGREQEQTGHQCSAGNPAAGQFGGHHHCLPQRCDKSS